MKKKPMQPMPVAERAKQFLPFAALKGFEEALARVEKEVEEAADGEGKSGKADWEQTD